MASILRINSQSGININPFEILYSLKATVHDIVKSYKQGGFKSFLAPGFLIKKVYEVEEADNEKKRLIGRHENKRRQRRVII